MNLGKLLECADAAKRDSTLIKNHRGTIDVLLNKQLEEVNYLLDIVEGDHEFTYRLEQEKIEIIEAMKVYL